MKGICICIPVKTIGKLFLFRIYLFSKGDKIILTGLLPLKLYTAPLSVAARNSYPANTQQRNNVASMSERRCYDVLCLLGIRRSKMANASYPNKPSVSLKKKYSNRLSHPNSLMRVFKLQINHNYSLYVKVPEAWLQFLWTSSSIYLTHLNWQVWPSSADPDQTLQNMTSNQAPHSVSINSSAGCKTQMR